MIQFQMLLDERPYNIDAAVYDDFLIVNNVLDVTLNIDYDLDELSPNKQLEILDAADEVYQEMCEMEIETRHLDKEIFKYKSPKRL
jgi:hypothetical protein